MNLADWKVVSWDDWRAANLVCWKVVSWDDWMVVNSDDQTVESLVD